MRASALLHVLAIVLIVAVAALIGFINTASSVWNSWILDGVVVVLCIGILLLGSQIRSIRLKRQSDSVKEKLSVAEARFQAIFNDSAVSEARFRAAFESSAIGMSLLTIEGRTLRANAAVRKMSGYTEEELEQRLDSQNVFPEDASVGLNLFAEMMAGQRDSYQVEKRYVRKSGEVFWTRMTLSAVRDARGEVAYLLAQVEDIDEQKRTLAELRKSEARFQAVFENAAVGITLVSLDRQTSPRRCSENWCDRDLNRQDAKIAKLQKALAFLASWRLILPAEATWSLGQDQTPPPASDKPNQAAYNCA